MKGVGSQYVNEGKLVPEVPEDDGIVSQAMSAKWAKQAGGPAGDEHHNLVVAPSLIASMRFPVGSTQDSYIESVAEATAAEPDGEHGIKADKERVAMERVISFRSDAARAGDAVVGPLQTGATPKGHGQAGVNQQAVESGHIIAFDPTAGSMGVRACEDGTAPGLKVGTGPQLDVGWAPAIAYEDDRGPQERDEPEVGHYFTTRVLRDSHTENQVGIKDGDLCDTPGAVSFGKAVHTTGYQGDRVVGEGDVHPALAAEGGNNGRGPGALMTFTETSGALHTALNTSAGDGNDERVIKHGMAVRRLTPVECERLQGFPDGWTCMCGVVEEVLAERGIDESAWRRSRFTSLKLDELETRCRCSDSSRYKALGNAVTVDVIHWIARRLRAQL